MGVEEAASGAQLRAEPPHPFPQPLHARSFARLTTRSQPIAFTTSFQQLWCFGPRSVCHHSRSCLILNQRSLTSVGWHDRWDVAWFHGLLVPSLHNSRAFEKSTHSLTITSTGNSCAPQQTPCSCQTCGGLKCFQQFVVEILPTLDPLRHRLSEFLTLHRPLPFRLRLPLNRTKTATECAPRDGRKTCIKLRSLFLSGD